MRSQFARTVRRAAIVTLAAAALVGGAATTASADEDGTWHLGEFAIWRGNSFSGTPFDTSLSQLGDYRTKRFVNAHVTLDNRANSGANGKNVRIYAFQGFFCDGDSITHLAYGEPVGQASHAYSDYGWFDDRMSSHWDSQFC